MKSFAWVLLFLALSAFAMDMDERCDSACQLVGFHEGAFDSDSRKCVCSEVFDPDDLGSGTVIVMLRPAQDQAERTAAAVQRSNPQCLFLGSYHQRAASQRRTSI